MCIDKAVNCHDIESQKPLEIEASVGKSTNTKNVITNLDFKIEELEVLQPRSQVGIEK